mmetsp:Transcript_100531/g.199695  ORF Transcript_100531/g.199695 Transcript_100531/m.199695 type:complete len:261 (+) Transcript_100531:48-830(+)|eukprot:CAMPEP_0172753992 /NCGR_PEP_ID=MMETSP1074-20121228/157040_1 /TAXON_ID=2916 /ORGANISM="Ceratium fusus, Strain PA161109" /LENGTH=260 /DNA_ID=CAMNT_0013586791 /DNA_START=32 /DNA_END=814 /DNA_ORIENTATION=-
MIAKLIMMAKLIMALAVILASSRTISSYIDGIREVFWPPPTSQQQLLSYAQKATAGTSFGYHDAEVINDMKMVGMEEMRAVTAFTAKRSVLKEKMSAELKAKRVPGDVIDAVVEGISSVSKYSNSFEEFVVDSSGTGKIFKATVMLKPDRDDDESSQVAMAVSGAQFNAAAEVQTYEEEEVPVFQEVEEIENVVETGYLGDYKVAKTVKKMKHMGTKKKRTPIFKQKTFTKAKLESIKKFLEAKTFGEVKMLYGPSHDEQ